MKNARKPQQWLLWVLVAGVILALVIVTKSNQQQTLPTVVVPAAPTKVQFSFTAAEAIKTVNDLLAAVSPADHRIPT